jgi:hypothetical protein
MGLKVKKSTIRNAGLGLFTTVDLGKGENIAEYSGEFIASDDYIEGSSDYALQFTKETIIDAKSTQTHVGRYANMCRTNDDECRDNNVRFSKDFRNKKVYLKAKRNIKSGEEIFVSYGRNFFN